MSVPSAYLAVVLIWTTTPLAVKWSTEGGGFLFGVTARMLIATVLTLAIAGMMRVRMPWHREAIKVYAIASLGVFGAMILIYWSAQYVPSGLISVFFAAAPIMTGVIAGPILGERHLTPARLAGMCTGFAGIALVFHASLVLGEGAWRGVLGLTAGVLMFSIKSVLMKRAGDGIHVMAINSGGLIIGTSLYLLVWLVSGAKLPTEMPTRAISAIVYLGIVGTVIGLALYMYLLRRLPVATLSLVTLITPVTALYLGAAVNGEHVGPSTIAGTALILAGLVLHEWRGLAGRLRPRRA